MHEIFVCLSCEKVSATVAASAPPTAAAALGRLAISLTRAKRREGVAGATSERYVRRGVVADARRSAAVVSNGRGGRSLLRPRTLR
jgi:hypothetical protein